MKKVWSFERFNDMDLILYRELWERDNPKLKNELMMIANGIDPFEGTFTDNPRVVGFGSQNSWYLYKRTPIWVATGEFYSFEILLHPTAENPHPPYADTHERFEVFLPSGKNGYVPLKDHRAKE